MFDNRGNKRKVRFNRMLLAQDTKNNVKRGAIVMSTRDGIGKIYRKSRGTMSDRNSKCGTGNARNVVPTTEMWHRVYKTDYMLHRGQNQAEAQAKMAVPRSKKVAPATEAKCGTADRNVRRTGGQNAGTAEITKQ